MILTHEYYKRITGDVTTPVNAWASAASAAQELLEDELARPGRLELAERTEQCAARSDGTIYPEALPIVSVVGGAVFHDGVVYGAQSDVNVFTGFFPGPEPQRVTLTYTGGFDINSAPAYMLRDLAWVTYAVLHPDVVANQILLAGSNVAQVGDVSVSYGVGHRPSPGSINVEWSRQTLRHRSVEP